MSHGDPFLPVIPDWLARKKGTDGNLGLKGRGGCREAGDGSLGQKRC